MIFILEDDENIRKLIVYTLQSQGYECRGFERFYRVDKSRSKVLGGTGLGLSIVKHAAKYHNASILVSSKEGEGSNLQKMLGKITGNRFAAVLTGIGVTAVIQSSGATVNARRTALVHVGFNLAGTILALLVFKPFLAVVDLIVPELPSENITTHIAMLHTIFNLCATLIFIPFVDQIAVLATRIIKDDKIDENEHYKFPAILPYTHVSADLYSFQIQKEISKMAVKVMEMFDTITNTLTNNKNVESENEAINQTEDYIDEMNEAITRFLQKCSRLSTGISAEERLQAETIEQTIDDKKKELRHLSRVRIENGGNVKTELNYIDLVRKIEKAGDCVFGIVQVS
ncbi:MAG: hypothetical protein KBT11_04545 [Treponema sp.]|nr:hypothetical protein [Candidatus Treponema equifaecale]